MVPVPNPISYEAIDRYADRAGYHGAQREWFEALIVGMDETYLHWAAERAQKRAG